ncbi:MAG TPA: GNAT family N-acetyltransferase [Nocardioides sp.]|uniref:GNAT family N-acetyltransferase n=1 Tax=Nocardioides sp. TaxID=35761 RepID=UPI002E2FA8C8|nr:GNAT family N-acetyltransferase [Nocardioides sp.]HEX5089019.1 GNAT family N-acetyltransferase [Nocardioides sp.]
MTALRLVGFADLTSAELDRWRALRAGDPVLDSAYFDPAFAAAVHASGVDVTVAVDARGDDLSVLMACQRDGSVLRPVGWPGADFQGPVLAPGAVFDPRDLLVDGVRSFEFDHWLPPCPSVEPWIESRAVSPYVEVSGGLDGYLSRASKSGKDNIGQARRRTARAERDLGPVTFRAQSSDAEALAWLIDRKREQYAATGARDHLASADRRALLALLLDTHEPGCEGIMSTLHFGDTLVAAHFGIRSQRVLHWWFPVYDPAFASFAPGWILLRELAIVAPELGLERIDLGRGDDEYKRRARTGEVEVAAGVVTASAVRRVGHTARRRAVTAAKSSRLAPLLRRAVHARRRRRAEAGRA